MRLSLPVTGLILLACVVLTVATAPVAEAQGPDPSTGSGQGLSAGSGQSLPYDEGGAQAIDRMLMCPVCPAVTIDQTQVELARQMQRVVREMLAQGANRQQVLDFFVERYGPGVLAVPSKKGFNLLAWILPPVGVVAALGALFLVLRSMVGRPGRQVATELASQEDLAPYLTVVDRELADPHLGEGASADAYGVAGGKAPAGVWACPERVEGNVPRKRFFLPLSSFRGRTEEGDRGGEGHAGKVGRGIPGPKAGR